MVCRLRRAPARVRACPCWTAFTFLPGRSSLWFALVVTPPTARSFICPGAAPCACSCFAHVHPCAQGQCGRCLPDLKSGAMMFDHIFSLFFSEKYKLLASWRRDVAQLRVTDDAVKCNKRASRNGCPVYSWRARHLGQNRLSHSLRELRGTAHLQINCLTRIRRVARPWRALPLTACNYQFITGRLQ